MVLVKDGARPDDYKFNLYFTYFNGTEWTGSMYTIDIRVNSWAQQHETGLQIIALIAGLITIYPFFSSGIKAIKSNINQLKNGTKKTLARRRHTSKKSSV